MTDAELLCRARTGDADAWRALYRRYLPAAWRQAAALTHDSHAAEDVAAEAMLALLQNLNQVEGGDVTSLSAWLRNVVRCKAADHFRKRRPRHGQMALEGLTNGGAGAVDGNGQAADRLEADERREQVLRALEQLTERDRLMLQWKYFDGLPVKELAERLGETERAVEAVLYRARKEFRRVFETSAARPTIVPLIRRDSDIPQPQSS
jgi:RNA polymerase sigma-70 factor, ECF subfamily